MHPQYAHFFFKLDFGDIILGLVGCYWLGQEEDLNVIGACFYFQIFRNARLFIILFASFGEFVRNFG